MKISHCTSSLVVGLAFAAAPLIAQETPAMPNRERVEPMPRVERVERMLRESRVRAPQEAANEKPWRIGVMVKPIDDSLRSYLDIPSNTGLIVTKCENDSPASKAGIMENDIILLAADRPVGSLEDLRDAVEKSGESLSLSTLRKGQRRQIDIRKEMPKPREIRPMPPTPEAPPTQPNQVAPLREQEAMMRRMSEQNSKVMECLERQEREMARLRNQLEEVTKAMREMKRDGQKKDGEVKRDEELKKD
jgi:hypothetical protein